MPGIDSGPSLVEKQDLVNPEAGLAGRDTWTEIKSGRNMARGGGSAHGYDDHRENHEEEFNRRFARRVAEGALAYLQRHKPQVLVVAASSHMLGLLRGAMTLPAGLELEVRESAKELAHMSPHDIHRRLAGAGLIPARGRVTA